MLSCVYYGTIIRLFWFQRLDGFLFPSNYICLALRKTLALSVPDEDFARNESCALKFYVFIYRHVRFNCHHSMNLKFYFIIHENPLLL